MTRTDPNEEAPIVHIVDDDDAVRYALMRLFGSVNLECRTYISGDEFIEKFTGGHPGCLVVDIRMPGLSGLEVQRVFKGKGIHMPVIVITGFGDTDTGVRAMKDGAFDFIQKPFSDQTLLDAAQSAIQTHIELRAKERDLENIKVRFASLSDREREVLDGILNGDPNKRIADKLNLSEKTIEFHRANIMKKMAARSLADLIRKTLSIEPR